MKMLFLFRFMFTREGPDLEQRKKMLRSVAAIKEKDKVSCAPTNIEHHVTCSSKE